MAPVRYFYQGQETDFVIFVDSEEDAQNYLSDSTVPLSQAVSTFQVFTTQSGSGNEGILEEASKQQLQNEFGKEYAEDVIPIILKKGVNKHNHSVSNKFSSTNDTMGRGVAHGPR